MEVEKWRLQMLLAVHPWGIPSLAYADAFKTMFGRELRVAELGFDTLAEMVHKLKDIFAVQEPDKMTALLFPEYSRDHILHDARLGHQFPKLNFDGSECPDDNTDFNDLIHQAWINRDDDFPPDVVLDAEPYQQMILMTAANISGTRGLHQGTMVGAASPDSFYIRPMTHDLERVKKLLGEIALYFKQTSHSIDSYNVPKEFIYPGFPCLSYVAKDKAWERVLIIGPAPRGNKVLVESVDFGGVYAVNQIFLYLIPRKFFDFPRQTIHVSLFGVMQPDQVGGDWPRKVGSRMRCFSFEGYYLDFLLLEPSSNKTELLGLKQSSPRDANAQTEILSGQSPPQRKKRIDPKRWAEFEVIVVDRNDDELDIYLDEVLRMETYVKIDDRHVERMTTIKQQLAEAFKSIPRPHNPFEKEADFVK